MIKVLTVFGTRPEAIKMAPVVLELIAQKEYFETRICVTAQHRKMLDQVISFFELEIDYDLNLMKPNQNLYNLTANVIIGMKPILEDFQPDYMLVHGDTTTSMASSIAGFYAGSKIVHIEAGLRTYNKKSPFPEEMNRQVTGRIADIHFAPTETSKNNLLSEGVLAESIFVTGNTVIDALAFARKKLMEGKFEDDEITALKKIIDPEKRIILITGHRRENFGNGFFNICKAIKRISEYDESIQIIYPVHLNPNVQQPVFDILGNVKNIHLINPLGYPAFVWLMTQSYIILTDSGGVQEEAPSLGKPVLVMRDTTERPEALNAGTVRLVGSDMNRIIEEVFLLLEKKEHYNKMSEAHNPYGDGLSSQRISFALQNQIP